MTTSQSAKHENLLTITEVAKMTEVQPYVLRFWESQFPMICHSRSEGGERLYGKKEILIIETLKSLFEEKMLSVEAAKIELKKRGLIEGETPSNFQSIDDDDDDCPLMSELPEVYISETMEEDNQSLSAEFGEKSVQIEATRKKERLTKKQLAKMDLLLDRPKLKVRRSLDKDGNPLYQAANIKKSPLLASLRSQDLSVSEESETSNEPVTKESKKETFEMTQPTHGDFSRSTPLPVKADEAIIVPSEKPSEAQRNLAKEAIDATWVSELLEATELHHKKGVAGEEHGRQKAKEIKRDRLRVAQNELLSLVETPINRIFQL